MIINLKNNYFIVDQKGGYILKQRRIRLVDGELRESVKKHGFYNNLETTIEKYAHLMRDELLENEVLELKEYAKLSDQCARIAIKDIGFVTK